MAIKFNGGKQSPVTMGEAKSIGRAIYAASNASRAIEDAASVIQTGARSVPSSELNAYAELARMYVDIFEKSREVNRRLREMAARLDSKRSA